jgi:hypothetical protein
MNAMNAMTELTSEVLRDICCAPENTDDPESIDFEDEPEETYFDERNDEDVFKN